MVRRMQGALALVLGLHAASCAAIAGLEDWQLGAADAGTADGALDGTADAPAESAADGPSDASDTGTTDTGREAGDAGCALGCPRASYDFDEGSGVTLDDRTGHGNTGTLQNGPVWSAGVSKGALTFDGIDDVVDIPSSPSIDVTGTGISILFWVNIDDTKAGSDDSIVNKAWTMGTMVTPYYQYGVEFSASSGKTLDFFFTVDTGTLRSGFSMKPSVKVWTHAAFTYDGATVKGYLDGVQKMSAATTGSIASRPTDLRLGVDGASAQGFKGSLDDLRIYDRALGPAEIAALRNTH
jgi:hypothetical protein